jgi:hypothetical protein
MHDPLLVRRFERVGNLARDADRLVHRQRPLCDPIGEGRSLDQLQHECARTGGVLEAVNVADVLMIERGEQLRFAMKAREAIGIRGEELRQDLQRDGAIQLGVEPAVDLAHATGAEQLAKLIESNPCAGRQCHVAAVSYLFSRSDPAITWPGRASVCVPDLTTATPLTKT